MRHGVLLIDKPPGVTSHDVVQTARRVLHEPKIGHLGTLDPAATGLLVLFVGRKALKVLELFKETEKEYEAAILFGAISSTDDREGVIEVRKPKPGWKAPSEVQLLEALSQHFTGMITQRPPAHSAIHINGKRAYELIRKDPLADLDIPERQVKVSRMQLISYAYPHATLRITCSSGTYIRSIARDLGDLLRCGAYLAGLRRTRIGTWKVANAQKPEEITWNDIVPLKEVLTVFPRHDLSGAEWEEIQHGRVINLHPKAEPLLAWWDDLPVALLEKRQGGMGPRKVL